MGDNGSVDRRRAADSAAGVRGDGIRAVFVRIERRLVDDRFVAAVARVGPRQNGLGRLGCAACR